MLPTFPIAGSPVYLAAMLGSIVVSCIFFYRRARTDEALFVVHFFTLCAAFLGAKIGYLVAEGWLYIGTEHFVMALISGKTIIGGLLCGYLGAEITKWCLGYTRVTGDLFATVVPCAILAGRVGCYYSGCCVGLPTSPHWYTIADSAGIERYATVPAEAAFQIMFIGVASVMRRRHIMTGQHFHIYLISYGVFRFLEEFVRDTPRIAFGITGYQVLALLCVGLGCWRFRCRANMARRPPGRPGWNPA